MHVNRDGVRKANAHPARRVGATGALAVLAEELQSRLAASIAGD